MLVLVVLRDKHLLILVPVGFDHGLTIILALIKNGFDILLKCRAQSVALNALVVLKIIDVKDIVHTRLFAYSLLCLGDFQEVSV